MAFSTGSFFTRDTNDSSHAYAKAASDTSYKYYNNMTWSWWSLHGPGVNHDIFDMWEDASGNSRSWLFSTQADGTFRTIFSWDGSSFSLDKTSNAVFDFSWKNIIVDFNNGVYHVYVNNVLQTLNNTIAWGGGAAGLFAAGKQVMIGARTPSAPDIDGAPGGCFNNFSMWNKVLSSSGRTALYNNGTPGDLTLHPDYANLTNHWRLDQTDTAPTLIDSKNGSASNMTITTSGASGIFAPSKNYATYSQDPGVATVLSGVTYVTDGDAKTGTYINPTAAQNAAAVWDELTASHTTAGSFGVFIKALLTVAKFLGLK